MLSTTAAIEVCTLNQHGLQIENKMGEFGPVSLLLQLIRSVFYFNVYFSNGIINNAHPSSIISNIVLLVEFTVVIKYFTHLSCDIARECLLRTRPTSDRRRRSHSKLFTVKSSSFIHSFRGHFKCKEINVLLHQLIPTSFELALFTLLL